RPPLSRSAMPTPHTLSAQEMDDDTGHRHFAGGDQAWWMGRGLRQNGSKCAIGCWSRAQLCGSLVASVAPVGIQRQTPDPDAVVEDDDYCAGRERVLELPQVGPHQACER